jgi:hypothetical protein
MSQSSCQSRSTAITKVPSHLHLIINSMPARNMLIFAITSFTHKYRTEFLTCSIATYSTNSTFIPLSRVYAHQIDNPAQAYASLCGHRHRWHVSARVREGGDPRQQVDKARGCAVEMNGSRWMAGTRRRWRKSNGFELTSSSHCPCGEVRVNNFGRGVSHVHKFRC